MEECAVMDTREKPGQDLEGAAKTAIPDNSRISPAHPEAPAANKVPAIRKELLDKLLDRKVTYHEIKKHGLSNAEIEYLYLNDIVLKREYLEVIKKRERSRRTAYRWWLKAAKESSRDFDPEPLAAKISALKQSGSNAEAERLKAWLDMRSAGGIPAREMFSSVSDYVVELLDVVRDELYCKKALGTKEIARMLGVSTRQVRRMAQKGTLRKEGRGVFPRKHFVEWFLWRFIEASESYLKSMNNLSDCVDDNTRNEYRKNAERIGNAITEIPSWSSGTSNGPDVQL